MSLTYLNKISFISSYLISYARLYSSVHRNKQMEKTMKKVLGNNVKKKIHYNEVISTGDTFLNKSHKKPQVNPKRMAVLNKLFMRNITDLMSTGEYASAMLGLGVEVNKVKITPDFKILQVYWVSQRSQEKAEEILQQNAGLLRHELSKLRLMGNVPIIQFIKDKQYANIIELNNRLAIADFGEEGPSNIDPAAHLVSEFELSIPVEKHLKDEIEKLEKENPELDAPQLPPMSHYVFDLDHAGIMNRIKKTNKSTRFDNKNKQVDERWTSFKLKQYSNIEPLSLGDDKSQRDAFNKFLQQRQILKMKQKEEKYKHVDTSFVQEEQEVLEMSSFIEINEDDFIAEDDSGEKN